MMYLKNDPIFVKFQERLTKDWEFSPSQSSFSRETYNGWCPEYNTIGEKTVYRPIVTAGACKIDLEYAILKGPVKIEIYTTGGLETKFFEHSVEGMEKALEYAKQALKKFRSENVRPNQRFW